MLDSTNIAQINKALESSFAAIKKDITDIKLSINSQVEENARLKRDLDSAKAESVTKNKLNALKIKIGELNEGLKKIWDIERQLKNFDPSKTKKMITSEIEELNAKLIATNMKINEIGKQSASESQMKTLVADVNNEMNSLHQEIKDAELDKEEVQQRVIEKHTEKLSKEIGSTNEEIAQIYNDLKKYVSHNEVKRMLDTVNDDFDIIRVDIDEANKASKVFVKENEVKNVLKSVNKEFDGVSQELAELKAEVKKQNKIFVTGKQVKTLADDIGKEFSDVRYDLDKLNDIKGLSEQMRDLKKIAYTKKDFDSVKTSLSELQGEIKSISSKIVTKSEFEKELKMIDKELNSLEKKTTPSVVMKTYASAKKVKSRQNRKTYYFGNFSIFISFMFLIASIISYYVDLQTPMDNFAIAAVVFFILGMAARVYVVAKSK